MIIYGIDTWLGSVGLHSMNTLTSIHTRKKKNILKSFGKCHHDIKSYCTANVTHRLHAPLAQSKLACPVDVGPHICDEM